MIEDLLIQEIGSLEERLEGLDMLIEDNEGFDGHSIEDLKEARLRISLAISIMRRGDK